MAHLLKTTIVRARLSGKRIQELCHFPVIIALLGVIAVLGCSKRYSDLPVFSPIPIEDYQNHSVGRFKTSYLAEQIDNFYRGTNPGPIGITTFVNIDDLHNTSTFGRMYGEQLMSELAMRGYDVVELRHADALQFLNNTGEFALSRDMGQIKRVHNLGGVIVGTYVVSPERVYINARLVDPSSSIILSAGSVEMSKTEEIARMLRGGSFPGTLERIPVRHLGTTAYPATMFQNQTSRVYNLEEEPLGPTVREQLPAISSKGKLR